MKILALETSCDETAAAILDDDRVLTNQVRTQKVHASLGGVVPEIASREHIRIITEVVDRAFEQAGVVLADLDLVAATRGPGLLGALLVGYHFARGLALRQHLPFFPVNHMEGHVFANYIDGRKPAWPTLVLVVSGGHTQLLLSREPLSYELLGNTRDDAAGEAFDKGAKILGLGYPGGPIIEKLADDGHPDFYRFPRGMMKDANLEFSFSGLKTALLHYTRNKGSDYVQANLNHIAASYQEAIVDVLARKTVMALESVPVSQVVVAGGVAANRRLRARLQDDLEGRTPLVLPKLQYCTDNAAMIARAALARWQSGWRPGNVADATSSLSLFAGDP